MLDRFVLQKIGAVCGFVVPIVAFGCISAAVVSYPEFSWTNSTLSDLGVVFGGVTAPFFNFGLFTTGLLCFFFGAIGLFSYFKDTVIGKIGAVVFVMAAVWLMVIGVFNESFWPAHFIVSVLFFITLPVGLWLLTVALNFKHEVKLAVFTLVSSFTAVVPWIFYFIVHYVPNVAFPETISAVAGSVWVIVLSYKIFKTTNQQHLMV
ncbi:MAG: DUF998 domain-containing protein [Nitrososphaerota archaeon]|jgi:hypothetical membrane protein|nr:DUF998 domain-containing protein [Nitrososphaerota archaeon]